MHKCEKCGKDLGWYTTRLKMRGCVFAYLCPGCETEYAEHIMPNEHFRQYAYLQAVELSIIHARELSQDAIDPVYAEVQRELFECLDALRAESLRWLGRED